MQNQINQLERDMMQEINRYPDHSKKRLKLLYMSYCSIIRNYELLQGGLQTPNYDNIFKFMNHKDNRGRE